MIANVETAKTNAYNIRFAYIEDMEKHILDFETKLISKKINVKWVNNEENLVNIITSMMPDSKYNAVCFNLKNTPQEILKNKTLFKHVPAKDFNTNKSNTDFLFVNADFGIIETGSLVFINNPAIRNVNNTNELVVLLDINNLVVKQSHLDTLTDFKTVESDSNHITFIKNSLPKIIPDDFVYTSNEKPYKESAVTITVLLYDNGITDIMSNPKLREAIFCIDCGRCKKVCPVYNFTKKYSPIELIRYNALVEHVRDYDVLENTTLCENCNIVCPVKIPLSKILIEIIKIVNTKTNNSLISDRIKLFSKRSHLNKLNGRIRHFLFCRKTFKKNSKLYNYFKDQKDTFFNLSSNGFVE